MNFLQFQQSLYHLPLISLPDIRKHFPDFDPRRLVEWQQKGYIQKVRNGFYLLNTLPQKPCPLRIAQTVYGPAYLSLQSALSHHGLIPEWSPQLTLITSLKTFRLRYQHQHFIYRHLRADLFVGYTLENGLRIAFPEKALLDLIWLETTQSKVIPYLEELRLNFSTLTETVNPQRFNALVSLFGNTPKIQQAYQWISKEANLS